MKYIVCYSGGHASAICAIEAARMAGPENVILVNHDMNEWVEDADIKRFKQEVADYIGIPITPVNMQGVEQKDHFGVCMEIKAFKCGGQSSALCTNRLKTDPFNKWLAEHYPASKEQPRNDIAIVYGFHKDEPKRIQNRTRILSEMGYLSEYPLVTWESTISNTEEVGITRPKVYQYRKHANCDGCLKGGKQSWYVTYCRRPDVFEKAKHAEQVIGHSILRDGFLKDHESLFKKMVLAGIEPTEHIKPQRFWSQAKKAVAELEMR